MMNKVCALEGCEEPLNHGAMYCSTTHANVANAQKRKAAKAGENGSEPNAAADLKMIRSGVIPSHIEDMFVAALGNDGANAVLSEIEDMYASGEVELGVWPEWLRKRYPTGATGFAGPVTVPSPSMKPTTGHKIEPDTTLVRAYGQDYVSELRRSDDITIPDIDRMLKLGPCVVAARLKQGPIMSALSGKRKWSLRCKNNKLKAVIEADLERFFLRHVHDILTSLEYGVAFGSVIWESKTAEEIGVESGVGDSKKWWAVDKVEWAHPSSVKSILRKEDDLSFNGFVHRKTKPVRQDIVIDPMQALVITYNGRFGNMWGQSMFEPVYDFAYWYERVMASFLRYLKRMATPVVVVEGPNRGTWKRPDGTRVNSAEYGLMLAGAVAVSEGIYLPSERDIQHGHPLWRAYYLDTDQKGDQFIAALQYLGTQIMRGALVGDRAFTQDGDTGSYNAGQMHNRLTQIDNDFIFKKILSHLNDYLVKRYGMFNVSYNSPPLARLVAEVIDPDEQEVLMKLFSTAGNFKMFDGSPLDRVDWEEAFRSINVPVVDDKKFNELYKEHMDQKKESMKMMQEIGPPKPGFQQGEGQQQQQPTNAQKKLQPAADKEARLGMIEHIAGGGQIPILLTPEQESHLTQSGEGGTISVS